MALQFSVTLLYRHFSGGDGKKKEEAGGNGRGLRRGDGPHGQLPEVLFPFAF